MMTRVMMYCLCAREERDREDARRVQELLEKEVVSVILSHHPCPLFQAEEARARDEALAQQFHRTEMETNAARRRQQEEADMRFARQHSMEEQAEQRRLEELSLREIRRLQDLDLSKGPPLTAALPPPVSSIIGGDSLPTAAAVSNGVKDELPSYDSLMFDGDDDEETIDESDRQALQEQRDIELARQLHEKEARKIAKNVRCETCDNVCILFFKFLL